MATASENQTALKILIVDDSEDIRDVLCQMVERFGHIPSTANDGMEALDALKNESFDVMILDIGMPRLSGIGVARWLHDNLDVAPSMRTVVLSASADQSRGVLAELGVDTVMQKPLRMQQMRDLLAEGFVV
jgi:CheY-like chemotaxis protein